MKDETDLNDKYRSNLVARVSLFQNWRKAKRITEQEAGTCENRKLRVFHPGDRTSNVTLMKIQLKKIVAAHEILIVDILEELVNIVKTNEGGSNSEPYFFKGAFDKSYALIEDIAKQSYAAIITNFTQCISVHFPKIYPNGILSNLMSNSLKYYAPDRLLIISIRSNAKKDRSILDYSDNKLCLGLKIFGKKLFRLNQTFHQNRDRKGLGLFLIKTHVTSKGGTISVKSEENSGLKFI